MPVGSYPLAVCRRQLLRATAFFVAAPSAWAIDNPDAPDYVAQFEARARLPAERFAQAAGGPGQADAASAYLQFLDTELNAAYALLLATLPAAQHSVLVAAQRQWLCWRDAELTWLDANWTPQRFGSSAALTRADRRATLLRQRVVALLGYVKGLPAVP